MGKNEAKCDSRAQMPSMKVTLVSSDPVRILHVIARCNYGVYIHMHIFFSIREEIVIHH